MVDASIFTLLGLVRLVDFAHRSCVYSAAIAIIGILYAIFACTGCFFISLLLTTLGHSRFVLHVPIKSVVGAVFRFLAIADLTSRAATQKWSERQGEPRRTPDGQ
ncbi:hypothetical protein BD310DRAFT_974771 [Dichomitus squalens]|uniref:Uncharacterized protein n=1 Tax=Dichomitus squalens TaxID=114155 RepID=A0A4Q9Q414_9APHY|nr:hypothetical protein BD310DRAFT_974771 [Dichomitus squalens]